MLGDDVLRGALLTYDDERRTLKNERDREIMSSGTSAAIVRRLADVEPEQVRWLWPDRIPLGKLTLFAGDPGLGKSFVSLDIASRATVGGTWPDGALGNAATDVVLLNAEDDAADTIRPRLDRHGADVRRVHVIDAIRDVAEDGQDVSLRWTDLSRDLRHVEAVVERVGARVLIVDPISAYMGDRTDSHRNSDVRTVLGPLAEMAGRTGVAVVAITHFSKGQSSNAMYRSIGSIAFVAAARMAWGFGPHKDDDTKSVMLCLKCNLCAKPSGLAYRIVDGLVEWDANPVDMDANDLLRDRNPEDRSALSEASDFLTKSLADGPIEAKAVKSQAKVVGIAWRTVYRARRNLGIKAFRKGFGDAGSWFWSMPNTHRAPNSKECHNGAQCVSEKKIGVDGALWPPMDDDKPPADTLGAMSDGGASDPDENVEHDEWTA